MKKLQKKNSVSHINTKSPHNWYNIPQTSQAPQRAAGLVNHKIGTIIGVIEVNHPNFSYDAFSIAEQIGAVSLPFYINQNQEILIGITQNYRPIANCNTETWNLTQAQALEQNNYNLLTPHLGKPNWEIPRGRGEANLSSLELAIEELKEEISAPTEIQAQQIYLGQTYSNTAFITNPTDYFAIELTSTTDLTTQLSEGITKIKFVTLTEAEEMICDGRIKCAFSEGILYRFQLFLRKHKVLG